MTLPQDVQVFISVKHLDEQGAPTRDSEIARELHEALEARGLSSFLSMVSLEQMGAAEYKGAIDDALDHAEVLVAVGTSPENLASRWVRYEWDSFFNDIISGIKEEGKVFSLISSFPPNKLPRALRQNQTFDYEQAGISYLCSFLSNALDLKQAIRERNEAETLRRHAEKQTEKALAINQFLTDVLRSADPFRGGRGYATTVLEAVTAAESSISERFEGQPEVEAEVRHTLGTTFMHLGKYREAKSLLQSSLDICLQLYGEDHMLSAAKLNEIGRLCHETGEYAEAEKAFRRALSSYDRILEDAHPLLAATLNNLGILLRDKGDLDAAEEVFQDALAMKRALFGRVHEEVSPTLNNLGLLFHDKAQLAEAKSYFEEALAVNRQVCEPDHPTIGINLSNLAWVLVDLGEYEEALENFSESLVIKLKAQGENHPSTAISLSGQGAALEGMRQFNEALEKYRQAIEVFDHSLPDDHWRTPYTRSLYARCLLKSGRADGLGMLQESVDVLERILGSAHPKFLEAKSALESLRSR